MWGQWVLILNDTGSPKQGKHSVGVARQYCGALGKVTNCQVAVTCIYADSEVHWPVNTRLYLPKQWTDSPARCVKVGVPQDIAFQTKLQIALALLDEARESNIPHCAVMLTAAMEETIPSFRDWKHDESSMSWVCLATFEFLSPAMSPPGCNGLMK